VDLVVSDAEVELVNELGNQPMTLEEVAEFMRMKWDEAGALTQEAWRREIIEKTEVNGTLRYSPGRFYNNMDYWTGFQVERWKRLPQWARHAVSSWQEAEWIKLWTRNLEIITKDPDAYVRMKNRDVLLMEESLELVDASPVICLLPCACRTTLFPHSSVIEGSMRVGARGIQTLERGQGRAMTTDQAKAHIIMLDRKGLIHTGPRAWKQNDPKQEWISHGNCDPAYSFPFRAGFRLGLDKQYPRAHYVAEIDWNKCTHCGACMGRCVFGAFSRDRNLTSMHGAALHEVRYDAQRCWGCGLCRNTCPEDAIAMRPL
jgi:ferredoxin